MKASIDGGARVGDKFALLMSGSCVVRIGVCAVIFDWN